jgi:ABC-2 type transport system permease protein
MNRSIALVGKELIDLRQNLTIFLPSVIVVCVAILLPVFVAIIVPAISGERLADSSDFEIALDLYKQDSRARGLEPEAAVQAYLFQYFLVMLVLGPITSAMSVASFSVIGEKQARTLEPLLVTPLTTAELLAGKVLGALIPAVLLTLAAFALYVAVVAAVARPGVVAYLLSAKSVGIVLFLGPLAALVALQLAVCVSSRVNDPRTAQQLGVFVILPVPALLVGQLLGFIELTWPVIAAISLGLVLANVVLLQVAIRLFSRETILTRWR